MRHLWSAAAVLALTTASLQAEELDDLLGSFEEETPIKVTVKPIKAEKPSWIELTGDYTLSTAYNYQESAILEGVSRARNTLNLTLDMDFGKKWRSKVEFKTLYDPIYEIRDIATYTETL